MINVLVCTVLICTLAELLPMALYYCVSIGVFGHRYSQLIIKIYSNIFYLHESNQMEIFMSEQIQRLLTMKEVIHICGLSRPSIYRLMDMGEFPRQISVGDRSVRWIEDEVVEWVKQIIEHRYDKHPKRRVGL